MPMPSKDLPPDCSLSCTRAAAMAIASCAKMFAIPEAMTNLRVFASNQPELTRTSRPIASGVPECRVAPLFHVAREFRFGACSHTIHLRPYAQSSHLHVSPHELERS